MHYAGAPEARPAPGVLEALDDGGRDPDRAEQPVRLDRADPRRRRDPRRRSSSAPSVRRGQPADRRPRGEGPGRPDARAAGRRHDARARRRRATPGLIDALVIDEADAPASCRAGVRARRHADADDRRRRRAPARRRRARRGGRAGMKVAILGGTGSFGRALAARLVALGEDDVVIGSRDAERAQETAAELGGGRVTGATNEDAVRGADLAVLAVKADGALDTARAIARRARRRRRCSRVASAIQCEKGVGTLPDPDALSLAERIQEVVDAPVAAGLHSIAAANLDEAPPRRGCARLRRRRRREGARARARRQARRRPRARRGPARERARARRADRGDRQPEPPLQGARRRPRHRRRMISIIPVHGLPEIRAGRRSRGAGRRARSSSRTATSWCSRRRRSRRRRAASCASTSSRRPPRRSSSRATSATRARSR